MKRSEIIPALEALAAAWEAQFGSGETLFNWSLTDDPDPWVKLNGQYLLRACKFDDVPFEEARNRNLWQSASGFAFLDYTANNLYIGPINIYMPYGSTGGYSFVVMFDVPNPANPDDAEFVQALGLMPVTMREECKDCCKYHRGRCSGKAYTAFPELLKREKPKCFEECNDDEDCPYGPDECNIAYEHLPDHLMKIWEESLNN